MTDTITREEFDALHSKIDDLLARLGATPAPDVDQLTIEVSDNGAGCEPAGAGAGTNGNGKPKRYASVYPLVSKKHDGGWRWQLHFEDGRHAKLGRPDMADAMRVHQISRQLAGLASWLVGMIEDGYADGDSGRRTFSASDVDSTETEHGIAALCAVTALFGKDGINYWQRRHTRALMRRDADEEGATS